MLRAVEKRSSRGAHNPEVPGSNPGSATKTLKQTGMECEPLIRGEFEEIREVLEAVLSGKNADCLKKVTHISHPQDFTVPQVSRHGARDAEFMECGGVKVEATNVCPWCEKPFVKSYAKQQYCSTKCYQKVYQRNKTLSRQRQTSRKIGPRELVTDEIKINCGTCGGLFHPSHAKQAFCSKKCYMIDWRERNRPRKEPRETAPAAITAASPAPGANPAPAPVPAPAPAPTPAPARDPSGHKSKPGSISGRFPIYLDGGKTIVFTSDPSREPEIRERYKPRFAIKDEK